MQEEQSYSEAQPVRSAEDSSARARSFEDRLLDAIERRTSPSPILVAVATVLLTALLGILGYLTIQTSVLAERMARVETVLVETQKDIAAMNRNIEKFVTHQSLGTSKP